MAEPLHKFRPAAAPRNRVKDTCLIQTAPFSDWLSAANQPVSTAGNAGGTTMSSNRNQYPSRQSAQPRRQPGTPGHSRVAALPNATTNPAAANPTTLEMLKNGERLPLPWELDAPMSDIEWVVLHNLGKKYPEVYDYIMEKAAERGGDLDLLKLLERSKQ